MLGLIEEFRSLFAAPADTTGLARWPDGLERCDFLVFTCALTAANRHTLDADTLARCRRGVCIVNVARGSLIDGQALTAGLVHGAALDIFEREPLPDRDPLRGFEQVTYGAHNASKPVETVRRASVRAIEELPRLLAGHG